MKRLLRTLAGPALALGCLAARADAQDEERAYDPLAGIDQDGRIERPQLPADLPNPDRWRYTPPGRIAPGNVLERFLISSFFSPVVFRDEDIGTGGGIALTDIDFRNQDYREFANVILTYTTEGQQSYGINWRRWLRHRKLEDGGIVREERSSLFGGLGYSKTLTRRFFGFGSRTREEDETSYTEELTRVGLGARLSVPDPGDDLIVTGALRLERHELDAGHVSSVPSSETVFPGTIAGGDGVDQVWLDLGLAYDSRDSLHQPYRGLRAGVFAETALLQDDSRFGGLLGIDAQAVFPLPPLFHMGGDASEENPPTDVLAIGAVIADTHGDLPFYSLPSLGGSGSLRGYIDNRFTDRAAAHASLEYRFAVVPRGFAFTPTVRVERVGLALFYDVGTVAEGIEDLSDGKVRDSIGIGLRLSFAREAAFRIDYGVSDEGGNLTIRYGNAF